MSGLRRFLPANVGAEPKKLAILGVLAALLAFVFYMNSGSDIPQGKGPGKATTQTTLPKAGDAVPGVPNPTPVRPRAVARTGPRPGAANEEWVPTLKVADDFDLSQVDPTLQLARLDKVRAVGAVGGRRSPFEFYTPPPPPPPPVKIDPRPPVTAPPPPTTPVKAAPPPPPPIPLKFYGYEGRPRDTNRKAFFIDGEEIFIVGENELIRDRYKIIRLNLTSAEVEDTVAKNKQTLPLLDPVERP